MKNLWIVLSMLASFLFFNCDGNDPEPNTNNENVKVYMDYGHIEIPKSSIAKVLDFDEEIIEVVEEENVFAITGKKEGSTVLQANDTRGKKKLIHVSVFLALNVNRWSFDKYSVDIACADCGIRNKIMADLENHIFQCRESGKNPSSVLFKSDNIFDMKVYTDNEFQTLKGTYTYDLTNLVLTTNSGRIMTCRFSVVEELPMSWDATLTHDLTESYKTLYLNKVNRVIVNYSVSAAKILSGGA